jgi:hypothetical protein
MSSLHARRPPKLEQGDLRRNKQLGSGGSLRRLPSNDGAGLEIPLGGEEDRSDGKSRRRKSFWSPCKCITFIVLTFLMSLIYLQRRVTGRTIWQVAFGWRPLKSGGDNNIHDINIADWKLNHGKIAEKLSSDQLDELSRAMTRPPNVVARLADIANKRPLADIANKRPRNLF